MAYLLWRPSAVRSFGIFHTHHIGSATISSESSPLTGRRHLQQQHLRSTSTSDADGSDPSDSDWNQDAYWLQQIRKQGEKRPEYQWFRDRQALPFECTGCGKCCKTEGNVYMTPEEHQQAAELLDMTKEEFLQEYASHTLLEEQKNADDELRVWIRLRDRSMDDATSTGSCTESSNRQHGCIFLQEDNTCRIYEARPIQCSTYPFWPNILASQQAWNAEVRRADHDTGDKNHDNLPLWTAQDGGCEGMKQVKNNDNTNSSYNDDEESLEEGGVPREQVYEQAHWYEHDERRFPRGKEIPVTRY